MWSTKDIPNADAAYLRYDVTDVPTRDIIAKQRASVVYFAAVAGIANDDGTSRIRFGGETLQAATDQQQTGGAGSGEDFAAAFTVSTGLSRLGSRGLAVKVVDTSAFPAMATAVVHETAILHRLACLAAQPDAAAAAARVPRLAALPIDGVEPGRLTTVAMPYFRACPLNRLFYDEPRGLHVRFARAVAAQLVVIVEWLHRVGGVVHRDVKLTNVLVDPDGRIYLVDFGAAAAWSADSTEPATKPTGGTPHCQPPELLADPTLWGAPSQDAYGIGHVVYELLTGRAPFGFTDGRTPDSAVPAIGSLVGDTKSQYRSSAVDFVTRLLAYAPSARLGALERGGVDWDAVKAHPFLRDVVASSSMTLGAVDTIDAEAYEASAPHSEEIDLQLAGF